MSKREKNLFKTILYMFKCILRVNKTNTLLTFCNTFHISYINIPYISFYIIFYIEKKNSDIRAAFLLAGAGRPNA